jgi:hypothetical protein
MGERKTLLVVKIMAFIDWLRRQQERSEANRRLFEGRPMVPASEAWSGYQDSPGGQRLMVRQMQRPEVTNKLVSKNDGTQTLTKTWKDPDASDLRATGLGPGPETHPVNLQPWPVRRGYWGGDRGLRDTAMSQEEGLFRAPARRGLSPEAQAAIAQVQATRGQNVDASGQPITRMSLANLGIPIRAMGDAIGRMDRSMQGIRDRVERNRIRRLMQYRTRNPYFPTGGRY